MPYFRAFQLFWLRLPYLWIQSLLWWISIVSNFDIQGNPCWNRTLTYHFSTSISLNHDWTLGGPRYIHLTKETNAVFSGFSALLAPAAISMNSITLVMNFHCILFWHSGQSLLESNSDLSLSNFHKSQPWLNLRRRLLYPFNYENKCRIFKLFSLFRLRWPSLWTQSLLWWIICFLISTFLYATVQIELLVTAFSYLTALTMVMS